MTVTVGRPRTPAAPGPGPTPEALLRALDLSIGRRIRGLVSGEFRALDLGGGMELAQVRPYQAGDDIRRIDWNVTARMIEPHVRVHVPERALTTWLLMDQSPSMAFGTADRRKADVAEGVAIAVAHLSTQRGNRLGVLTFGGSRPLRTAPRGGRAGLLTTLIEERGVAAGPATTAFRSPATDPGTWPNVPTDEPADGSPAAAIRFVTHATSPGGIVVLVTDLRGPLDWLPELGALRRRHGLLVVEIRDPREDDLPDVGEVTLVDAETGREVRVDTSSATLRAKFAEAASRERLLVERDLRRLRARHVVLSTRGSWLRSFADQLRHRGIVA